MTIQFSDEIQAQINQRLQAGEFASVNDLMSAALKAIDDNRAILQERRAWLDAELQIGIDAANAGDVIEGAVAYQMQKDFLASLGKGK